jgi:biotin carboxyl carrier protein
VIKTTFLAAGRSYELDIRPEGGGFHIRNGDRTLDFSFRAVGDDRFELQFPDRTVTIYAVGDGDTRWIAYGGRTYELRREPPARSRRSGSADPTEGALRAPMPGQVRSVEVAVGDPVRKGQALLLLEAMKMEIRIQSPHDGTVTALPVAPGEQVEREQVLVEITKN